MHVFERALPLALTVFCGVVGGSNCPQGREKEIAVFGRTYLDKMFSTSSIYTPNYCTYFFHRAQITSPTFSIRSPNLRRIWFSSHHPPPLSILLPNRIKAISYSRMNRIQFNNNETKRYLCHKTTEKGCIQLSTEVNVLNFAIINPAHVNEIAQRALDVYGQLLR
ncbi:uncharacterized protein FFB14_07895 [Fusarium fujikuroi]|nr:uncharacterized protein FFB14_07895 [Fusarium fujikuroi]